MLFQMMQYIAETLQVILFKNDVYFLQKRYPHFKKSDFCYDINNNTEPLSIIVFFFEDVTGYRDIRRINLKSCVSIGLVIFATQIHKTNTYSR